MYTIGQVSEMFDLPISTLRYYDKEGFFLIQFAKAIFAISAIMKLKLYTSLSV